VALAVIVCLVGTSLRRSLDGIRFWSRRMGISRIYLLYGRESGEGRVFAYMSRRNAEDMKQSLEVFEPELLEVDFMDYGDVFKKVYPILSSARERGEDVLIDVSSTTDIAESACLTLAMMFSNARIYYVPSAEPAWYVEGEPGEERFERWFSRARNVGGREPVEMELPGYRLEPRTKREWAMWEREKRVLVSLLSLGGEASSISDVIRALGHRRVTSALRNAYGKLVGRLEDKGLVETERVRKRKVVRLTRFGRIMAEALLEAGA